MFECVRVRVCPCACVRVCAFGAQTDLVHGGPVVGVGRAPGQTPVVRVHLVGVVRVGRVRMVLGVRMVRMVRLRMRMVVVFLVVFRNQLHSTLSLQEKEAADVNPTFSCGDTAATPLMNHSGYVLCK